MHEILNIIRKVAHPEKPLILNEGVIITVKDNPCTNYIIS